MFAMFGKDIINQLTVLITYQNHKQNLKLDWMTWKSKENTSDGENDKLNEIIK